jgi:uncharacterized protein YwgA
MTPAQAHLLAILEAADVPSRTMLQKLIYFVARARHEDLGFAAHLYGPYSADVQEAIGSLVRAQLVAEQASSVVDWTGTELDGVQYRYALTAASREAAAKAVDHELRSKATRIVVAAKAGHAFSATGLSYAAKLAHIERIEGHRVEPGAAGQLAKTLGWKLTQEDIGRASTFLESIDRG